MEEWTPNDFDQHAAWLDQEYEAVQEPDFDLIDVYAEKATFA